MEPSGGRYVTPQFQTNNTKGNINVANEKRNKACARTLRALERKKNKDVLSITPCIQFASLLARKKKERVERTPGKTLRFTTFRHTRARKYSNSAARQHFHENLTPEKHNTRNKKWAYLEGIKRHRYLKETMQKVNRIGTNGPFGYASKSRQKRSYHGTQCTRD